MHPQIQALLAAPLLAALLLAGCDRPAPNPSKRADERIERAQAQIESAKTTFRADMGDWFERLELQAAECLAQVQEMPEQDARAVACAEQSKQLAMSVRATEEALAVYDDTWKLDWDKAKAELDAAVRKLDAETAALVEKVKSTQLAFREDYLATLNEHLTPVDKTIAALRTAASKTPGDEELASSIEQIDAAHGEFSKAIAKLRETKASAWREAARDVDAAFKDLVARVAAATKKHPIAG